MELKEVFSFLSFKFALLTFIFVAFLFGHLHTSFLFISWFCFFHNTIHNEGDGLILWDNHKVKNTLSLVLFVSI